MIHLEDFYIHVTPEESEIVQQLLFKCGFFWTGEFRPEVMLTEQPILVLINDIIYFSRGNNMDLERRTITLEELLNEIESKL